ncbi:MAG: hypothetical protein HYX96_01985 [Chloroflexi bacterium]|nr:hypothetical protein [Chloroflexota bacterium]
MRLTEAGRFSLSIPEPFNFRRTVAKPAGWHWSTPREIFADGALWSGVYLDGRPRGLRMLAPGRDVEVTLYAASPLTAGEEDMARSVVRAGLGAGEDLAGFYEFAGNDPVLSLAIRDLYGMRVGQLDDVFGRVILAILLQMAPVARSVQMMDAVLEQYGTRLSFDGREVILWPRPGTVAALDPAELRARAKLGYRAPRLVRAAQFLAANPVSLRELAALPEEPALEKLTAIPGIGRYSAGIILGQAFVPLDVWSVVIMSELVQGRTPLNPRQEIDAVALKLKQRWGRWGWLAFVYLLNDLENLARVYKLSRLR